jgi:transcriptional regulator of arginine metabolism
MGNKQIRQSNIREVLRDEVIGTHDRLAEVLYNKGLTVSQSTLSKDLRELGVVRMPTPEGGFRYAIPESGVTVRDQKILERELRDYLVRVQRAQNMVVAHTLSGHAQSVCEAIDCISWPEVMGTIAGDNTIFLLSSDALEAEKVVDRFGQIRGTGAAE